MNTEQQAFRVAYLIAGYLKGELTTPENTELDDWVTASMDNQRLFEDLTDPQQLDALKQWEAGLPTEQVLQRLKIGMAFSKPAAPSAPKSRILWPAVAAAAILLLALGIFWFYQNDPHTNRPVAAPVLADLPAGQYNATLMLADGRVIKLDTLREGLSIDEKGADIRQTDKGELSYIPNTEPVDESKIINTLTTPRGGQYRVILPDGTKVWLDAASVLFYPTRFDQDKRMVHVFGQAYFEVARDPQHPFIVKTNFTTVEVTGTHFNVEGQPQDQFSRVTLLEGSVIVNDKKIVPGQQARIDSVMEVTVKSVTTDPVIAWMKGQFLFKEATLEEILPQIARWYDAEIVYTQPIPYHFNADIPRSVPVSQVLHILEGTGVVQFQVEGKKIIVRPVARK